MLLLEKLQYLTEYDFDTNVVGEDASELLLLAAEIGNLKAVKLLINNGVTVAQDQDLLYSAGNGHLDIVKFLIQRRYASQINQGDNVPCVSVALSRAVRNRHLEVVKYLVTFVKDINRDDGDPILSFAAESGSLEVVEFFINQGVDLHHKDTLSRTVLFYAAENGHLDIVKFLVTRGALLHQEDIFHKTVLFYAAENGHLDVMEFFINRGSDLHHKDIDDGTALFYAAENGHLDIVKFLVTRGALLHQEDIFHKTVLFYAAENGHLDVVKYLVDQGADLHRKDIYGRTCLFYAAENGHLDVVKYLVDQGADLHRKDIYGRTALFHTAFKGWLDVVGYLVARGADLHHLDKDKRTVLSLVVNEICSQTNKQEQKQYLKIIKFFVERGVPFDNFSYVVQCEYLELFNYLVKERNIDNSEVIGYRGNIISMLTCLAYTVVNKPGEEINPSLTKSIRDEFSRSSNKKEFLQTIQILVRGELSKPCAVIPLSILACDKIAYDYDSINGLLSRGYYRIITPAMNSYEKYYDKEERTNISLLTIEISHSVMDETIPSTQISEHNIAQLSLQENENNIRV